MGSRLEDLRSGVEDVLFFLFPYMGSRRKYFMIAGITQYERLSIPLYGIVIRYQEVGGASVMDDTFYSLIWDHDPLTYLPLARVDSTFYSLIWDQAHYSPLSDATRSKDFLFPYMGSVDA